MCYDCSYSSDGSVEVLLLFEIVLLITNPSSCECVATTSPGCDKGLTSSAQRDELYVTPVTNCVLGILFHLFGITVICENGLPLPPPLLRASRGDLLQNGH